MIPVNDEFDAQFLFLYVYFNSLHVSSGDRGSTVVKVLRYKSEGRWFDPRWCHELFLDINSSDRTMALGSTQSLTEMSTGNISWR
jgi:hypothetical protein